MNFADPINWLWLLPLAGTIILLWLHRPRREEVVVPSLRLWRGLLAEDNSDPSRHLLRKHLLLVLQLLTIFLLSLALARPFLLGRAQAGQQYVLIVDNSASMQATDVQPSRLEVARAEAARFVAQSLRAEDMALVMQTSPRPQLLCRMTGDPARLRTALAQIPPTDTPGDLAGALALAHSVAGGPAVHQRIYSDGITAQADGGALSSFVSSSFASSGDRRQIVVGMAHPDNIGITGLEVQAPAAGAQVLTVTLSQVGGRAHPGLTLALSEGGRLRDARQVTFARGAARVEFAVPLPAVPQVFQVHLEHCTDDLASDNTSSIVLLPAHPAHVLLVSAGSLFLERGLASLPTVQVTEISPAQFVARPAQAAHADAVVLDSGFSLGAVPPGRYLSFGRAGLPTPLLMTPQPPADLSIQGQSAHPVMRFVDMRGVRVRSLARTQAAGWAQTLVASSRGPLVAAGEANGSRVVSVGFDLADSDLPLHVAFPLFLANSIAWLTEGTVPGTVQPEYAAGQTAQVALPPGARALQFLRPDGTVGTLSPPPAGGTATLADTAQVGVYTVLGPNDARFPLAVNLGNVAASALVPRQLAPLFPPSATVAQSVMHRVHRDWWTVAAALALLLLAGEWWVYHRRA